MNKDNIEILKADGVGVLPTDTLYGIVGRASSQPAVERIYSIKKRTRSKGFIILISSIKDLEIFNIYLPNSTKKILQKYWPGKVSVILPFRGKKFAYLNVGEDDRAGTLAFRFPNKKELIEVIKETGPLVAPSANPEGLVPAKDIETAKKYFGNMVDFYEDGGVLKSEPSTLVEMGVNSINILRKGVVEIL